MLDPRRLLTFRAVARKRSFSAAARELSLTQPAVSQQIRALELQLGERLIERGAGSFGLTRAGELLLEQLAADTWTAATPDGLIHRACVGAGFEPSIAYLTADPLAIRALVASDLAVTLTGRLLAEQLQGLATAELVGEPARQGIYAV